MGGGDQVRMRCWRPLLRPPPFPLRAWRATPVHRRARRRRRRAGIILLKCRNSETCNKKEKTPFHDHLEYLPIQNPLSGRGLGLGGEGGGVHIDLLTPSLSTIETTAPAQCAKCGRESRPSTVVAEEGRYSLGEKQQSPIGASTPYPKERLLATTPPRRTGCPFPHDERFVSFRVSYRFTFQVTPHGVPNPMYVSVRCLPWPLPLYLSSGE